VFEGVTIGSTPGHEDQKEPMLRLSMEFDDNFELQADPAPRAILMRKPPSRVSYIGVRVDQVADKRHR